MEFQASGTKEYIAGGPLVLALPVRRPPLGLGSVEPRLVPGGTRLTLEDLVVILGLAPVSEHGLARSGTGVPL